MHQPKEIHGTAGLRILAYIKSSPEKICCKRNMNMFVFLVILTQDMLMRKKIRSPLLAIAHSLEKIW